MDELYARNPCRTPEVLRTGAGSGGRPPAAPAGDDADGPPSPGQRGQTPGRRRPSVGPILEPAGTHPSAALAVKNHSTQVT